MLAGVAAGVADYLGVDVTIVRIILAVLTVVGGAGIPLYLAGWLLIPEEGSEQSLASELIQSRRCPPGRTDQGGRITCQRRAAPTWLLAASRRRTSYAGMRISDAERAEVADLLSKHYGDGRLDQAEFNQRLDQAMKAKTYPDLDGLLADLPRTDAEAAEAPKATARRRHEHPYARVLLLTVIIVIGVATAAHALAWSFSTWVWLGLLGALLYATQLRRR